MISYQTAWCTTKADWLHSASAWMLAWRRLVMNIRQLRNQKLVELYEFQSWIHCQVVFRCSSIQCRTASSVIRVTSFWAPCTFTWSTAPGCILCANCKKKEENGRIRFCSLEGFSDRIRKYFGKHWLTRMFAINWVLVLHEQLCVQAKPQHAQV